MAFPSSCPLECSGLLHRWSRCFLTTSCLSTVAREPDYKRRKRTPLVFKNPWLCMRFIVWLLFQTSLFTKAKKGNSNKFLSYTLKTFTFEIKNFYLSSVINLFLPSINSDLFSFVFFFSLSIIMIKIQRHTRIHMYIHAYTNIRV